MARRVAAHLALALLLPAAGSPSPTLRGAFNNVTGVTDLGGEANSTVANVSGGNASGSDDQWVVLNVTENITEGTEDLRSSDDGGIPNPSKSCAASENYGSHACYLYRTCSGNAYCVVNGYMIVPGAPLRGMEDINGGNAGSWNFLWNAAQSQCGSDSCVLIANPAGHRTQHQMHLHYRQYNGGGAALKQRLESALCHTSGWRPFNECGGAKAQLFSGMPGVFSTVASAYGGGSLANVGITVWFTRACGGGQKVMVLAQTGCSIEHSISAR